MIRGMRWLNLDDNPLVLSISSIISGVAGIIGAGEQASAAKSAAQTQANAAKYAADLQSQGLDKSLNLQQQEFQTSQQNMAPWLQAGQKGLLTMQDMLLGPNGQGGSLLQGFNAPLPTAGPFAQSPEAMSAGYMNLSDSLAKAGWKGPVTAGDVQAQMDPGFQFRMDQSNKIISARRAAMGMNDDPSTTMKLIRNSQDLASQEYQNAFGRATGLNQQEFGQGAGISSTTFGQGMGQYGADLQSQLATYGTAANTFYQNQLNQYNRLAGLSGTGQQSAGQIGNLGSQFANASGGLTMGAMGQIGAAAQSGAAATAGGQIGASNAWTGALSNLANQYQNYSMMNRFFPTGNPGSSPSISYNPQPGQPDFMGPVMSPDYSQYAYDLAGA